MAYSSIHGYTHDVFVSYAHIDDQCEGEMERGWVKNFLSDLQKKIQVKLGSKEASIWGDWNLRSNDELTTRLKECINNCATYIIILSPGYLESDYCKREREEILTVLKNREAKSRIFLVEKDEVDRVKFQNDLGIELVAKIFWTKPFGEKTTRTLGIPQRDSVYLDKVGDIAFDISEQLKNIVNDNPKKNKGTVFIAEVTSDLLERSDELKRYLKELGYRVLPENDYYISYLPEKLEEEISGMLDESAVYIQLVDNQKAKKLPNFSKSVVEFQFEIAKKKNKPMMVWRSSTDKVDTFIDDNRKLIWNSEYTRAENFEDFKIAILNSFIPKKKLPDQHDSTLVYIWSDPRDKSYCESIIVKELKKRKIGYAFPMDTGDPADVREFQEVNFLLCDAAVFVYCNTKPATVHAQLMHLNKKAAARSEPLKVVAIYDGPPDEKGKIDMQLAGINVSYLNCRENHLDFINNFITLLQ